MSVECRVETLMLKTYLRGPDDVYPPFHRHGHWRVYPYSMMDDLGDDAQPVAYRALTVENEYLRVVVLPELGGHLYSALDKTTGEDLFYRNRVVKPGLVALRGAWISGGVEFNFPRGHTVTTISPVDARLTREKDGGATVWVGDLERLYRMAWAVGIRLRPGSSLLETEVRLHNRTALPHPYYFWANAAVPARDDMQLVYPATRARTWQGEVDWPVHEGRDLSRYTSYRFSSDSFMLDSREDFFGVYYEQRDFGVVHIADVHECLGKKYFTWGTAPGGRMWASILSDDDGPYCEIQSGRYVDQQTWRLMPPHHTERWREYWYPVARTGGFQWANREVAVRLVVHDREIEAGVIATRRFPEVRLALLVGNRVVHEVHTELAPDHPFRTTLPRASGWPPGPLTLSVREAGGRELIRYTQEQRPRTQPARGHSRLETREEARTCGELLRRAVEREQLGETEEALACYEKAAALDPDCVQARIGWGRLLIEAQPAQAVEVLAEAATRAPESEEAAYYHGAALRRAGRPDEAEAELWRAAHRPAFAHAARVELTLIALARRDWDSAVCILRQALDYDAHDSRARALLAAGLRRAGAPQEAARALAAAREEAPLERLLAAEAHFCAAAQGRPRAAASWLRQLREMVPPDAEPWLELACDYLDAGLREEAAELLGWAVERVPAAKRDPQCHYLLACLYDKLGKAEEADKHREAARACSPELVFPHHWEMEAALREAAARNPDDGAARHYLGLLLFHQGRREEALREWERAAECAPHLPTLQRNLALAYHQVKRDAQAAAAALRREVARQPAYPRPYLELDEALQALKADPRERLALLDSAPPEVQRRAIIAAQQVAACIAAEQWQRAIELLTTRTFHTWEAEYRMRVLYVEAYLGRGALCFDRGDLAGARRDFEAALEYPANLRIGRPAQTEDARARWCAGLACELLGDLEAARAHWEAAAAERYHRHLHTGAHDLHIYRALSLRKLSRLDEAERLLEEELKAAQERVGQQPEDAQAQFTLGLALRALGRAEDAAAPLQRALQLDPWHHRARRLLAQQQIL